MLVTAAGLPGIGSPALKASAEQLAYVKQKADKIVHIFDFFVNGHWHFQNERIEQATSLLSKFEYEEFNCDTLRIEWDDYLLRYTTGMAIWALNED